MSRCSEKYIISSMRPLLLTLWLASVLPAQTRPTNGDFEAGSPGQVPPGWGFGSSGGPGFTGVLVNQDCIQGQQCVLITGPANPVPNSFGVLSTGLPVAPYLLKKIRFRAAVRVDAPT